MDFQKAIVNPVCNPHTPNLPPVAVMAATRTDLISLCKRFNLDVDVYRSLFISRLYQGHHSASPFALVGPLIGAPYAVMLLENLIAWGAQKILFFGWCGAVAQQIHIGDIILPAEAVIDEGTSRHYISNDRTLAQASPGITAAIRTVLTRHGIGFHEGRIWTTDGIYRETIEKVEHHQANAVLAVEMELSALFSVGDYRGVEVGGLLAVSDDLSSLKWRPGFKDESFSRSRQLVQDVLKSLIVKLSSSDE